MYIKLYCFISFHSTNNSVLYTVGIYANIITEFELKQHKHGIKCSNVIQRFKCTVFNINLHPIFETVGVTFSEKKGSKAVAS